MALLEIRKRPHHKPEKNHMNRSRSKQIQAIAEMNAMRLADVADLRKRYGTGVRPAWVSAEIASIMSVYHGLEAEAKKLQEEIDAGKE